MSKKPKQSMSIANPVSDPVNLREREAFIMGSGVEEQEEPKTQSKGSPKEAFPWEDKDISSKQTVTTNVRMKKVDKLKFEYIFARSTEKSQNELMVKAIMKEVNARLKGLKQ